jgi:glycosyltransferase involved in cell wall biosynthesis
MKKVLILSYMFPPIAGGGTQRPLKFVKYLPDYGITPIVFCPQKAYWKAFDESLLDLPFVKKTKIYRCGIRQLRHYYNLRYKRGYKNHPYYYLLGLKSLCFLDFFSTWYFECRQKALEVIKAEKVDCIMTTSPPHSIHFFGLFLKKMTSIPWIMDIRDAIVGDPHRPSTLITRVQDLLRYLHEKRFVSSSDAIISVSDPIIDSIRARHRALKLQSKLQTISNGFDEEDFANIQISKEQRNYLLITYTGSFMGKRTPEHFLNSIRLLIDNKSIDPSDLKIQFVGHYDASIRNMLQKFGARIPIEILDFQPYEKSLSHQAKSDLLLLIVSVDEKEQGQQIMTGKFFEYIGAKRPVFALVPDGPLKNIILKGGFGYVAPPKDISGIAESFLNLYERWIQHESVPYSPDLELRSHFSRKRLTEKLATIIRNVVD